MLDDDFWNSDPGDNGLYTAYLEGDDFIVYEGFPDYFTTGPLVTSSTRWQLARRVGAEEVLGVPEIAAALGRSWPTVDPDTWIAAVLKDHVSSSVRAFLVGYAWPRDPRLAWTERAWIDDQSRGTLDPIAHAELLMTYSHWLAEAGYVGAAGLLPTVSPSRDTFMKWGAHRSLVGALREHGLVA